MNAADFSRERAAFDAYNRSKDLSPRTIKSYNQEVRQFFAWFIEKHGQDAQITARRIREYMAARLERGNVPGTVRSTITSLRAFYRFLVMDEIIAPDDNPMRFIKYPRMRQPKIQPLSAEEVDSLLECFDRNRPLDYRNFVICLLMLDTGLRIGEVTRLALDDIYLEGNSIKVLGKGRKERRVYFGQKMKEMLQDYIYNCRRWIADGHDTLFPPAKWSGNATMSPHTLSEIMRKKMDEAGIPRANSSGHRLRHTFAANAVRAGINVFALQKLLGHATLEMTRRYVMLFEEDLAAAYRSPMDRMAT